MKQSNTDDLVSMRLPAIVVVRGQSSPEKSKLAGRIANFLKYPLFEEEDILKVSSYGDPVPVPHETCLEIILRMASTQLVRSQTGVVISATAFSYPAFRRLQELKNSTGARMIVILYEPEDRRLDLKDFLTVWIDPTKPVFLQGKLGREILSLFTGERITETHNSHFHYLTRCENQKRAGGKSSSCRKCSKTISDPNIYRCEGCSDCALHTFCAETPRLDSRRQTDKHYVPPCFSGKSLSSTADIEFPTGNSCGGCTDKGEFSKECFECLYEAFIRSKSLPAIMTVKWHKQHSLRYVIMPRSYGYTYHCVICDIGGEMAGYKCFECCLDFHPMCVVNSIREMVKSNHHSKHALRLQRGGNDDEDGEEQVGLSVRCKVCERSIEDPLVWRYVCSPCNVSAHTGCILEH